MPKICYASKSFRANTLALIDEANLIVTEYQSSGFSLTLRQLYYQMVARTILPNKQSEYKRLGSIINDARLAGLVDWHAIVDRTRSLRGNSHWDSPVSIVRSARQSYLMDKWRDQPYRVEAWIEKDALVGVIQRVCRELDVNYFSCRGYASASSVWRAGGRLASYLDKNQNPLVLFLSDHDPSGIDMQRDLQERLSRFAGAWIEVKRIALTMDQIDQYGPPPNPAKVTDSRYKNYAWQHGNKSWELDALEPQVLVDLIEEEVLAARDEYDWNEKLEIEEQGKQVLREFELNILAETNDLETA